MDNRILVRGWAKRISRTRDAKACVIGSTGNGIRDYTENAHTVHFSLYVDEDYPRTGLSVDLPLAQAEALIEGLQNALARAREHNAKL